MNESVQNMLKHTTVNYTDDLYLTIFVYRSCHNIRRTYILMSNSTNICWIDIWCIYASDSNYSLIKILFDNLAHNFLNNIAHFICWIYSWKSLPMRCLTLTIWCLSHMCQIQQTTDICRICADNLISQQSRHMTYILSNHKYYMSNLTDICWNNSSCMYAS